jgi:ribulose 1,5-bisphosphate synthetase/thiazole synthase
LPDPQGTRSAVTEYGHLCCATRLSGPAGLFSALALAQAGKRVVLLERGKAVEDRGRDIGEALMFRDRHFTRP